MDILRTVKGIWNFSDDGLTEWVAAINATDAAVFATTWTASPDQGMALSALIQKSFKKGPVPHARTLGGSLFEWRAANGRALLEDGGWQERHVEDVHFWGFGAPALFWPPPLLRPWAEEGSDGSKHASACWSVTNANKKAWKTKDFMQLLAALPFKNGCFFRDRK